MINSIYVLDNNKHVASILSVEDVTMSNVPYGFIYDDLYSQYLNTGAETFEFTVKITPDNGYDLEEGNYVLFEYHNKLKMFQIKTSEENESILSTTKTVYCETIGLELANSQVRPMKIDGNILTILSTLLADTNYLIGEISPSLDTVMGTLTIESLTPVYTCLQDLVSIFGGIEYEFRVECLDTVTGNYQFYIDVYANGERGEATYKRFEYDHNTYGMKRTGDMSDFCSALVAEGNNGITIKEIEWIKADGDPLDKPLGQDFLLDPDAHAMLSNGDKPIMGYYKSDATSPADLIYETYNKLQEMKKIKYTYEIPAYLTEAEYEEIGIGDTVFVINPKFNPNIQLQARIGILELSFTDRSNNKITMSNFKEIKSRIRKDDNSLISDVITALSAMGVGKLTEANIQLIQQYLAQLSVEKEEVDAIVTTLYYKYNPNISLTPVQIGDDNEIYSNITVKATDGGLWIGDGRMYNVLQYNVATVRTTEEIIVDKPTGVTGTPTIGPSNPTYQNYAEAVKYYEQWDLGKSKNDSTIQKVLNGNDGYNIMHLVNYWANVFGLDPRLVLCLMRQESGCNPYSATSSSVGGYGLMQCERGVYFGKTTTIKYLDGTTSKFTPSLSTMKPGNGGKITIAGKTVDKNISNQIMFGCNELRQNCEKWHWNIFATLVGYNMGIGAMGWIIIKYTCEKYGYSFGNQRSISKMSSAVQTKCYQELETLKMQWASYRQQWKNYNGGGTVKHVEYCLRYYVPDNNSLPYVLDSNRNKKGYGYGTTTTAPSAPPVNTRPTKPTGNQARTKIVDTAKSIVQDHQNGKATYDQSYRTIDYYKPRRHPGTFYGLSNPVCYDCSSFVGCCYQVGGMPQLRGLTCSGGTLVKTAISVPGWKAWKVTSSSIADALPGDIVMDANSAINANTIASNPRAYSTHHTMIYIGDGKVAHASKWAYKPNAIKISTLTYYVNKGSAFFLRPGHIKQFDSVTTQTEVDSGTSTAPSTQTRTGDHIEYIQETIVQEKDIVEQTIKALPNMAASDFIDTEIDVLIQNQYDENTGLKNELAYPATCNYVFCHLGKNNLDEEGISNYKSLLKALRAKYPNIPIFFAKEFFVNTGLYKYGDAEATNLKIADFNDAMLAFANEEDWIIQLDIGKWVCTDPNHPNMIVSGLTNDGITFKDATSTKCYYASVKDAVQNKTIGSQTKYTTKDGSITNRAEIQMQTGKTYNYGKVKNILFNLPVKASEFWSKLTFTTMNNSEPTKILQDEDLYLSGDDCIGGVLIPDPNRTYTIVIVNNPNSSEYRGLAYYGEVTATGEGANAEFNAFIGAENVKDLAATYVNKSGSNYPISTYELLNKIYKGRTYDEWQNGQWDVNTNYSWAFIPDRDATMVSSYASYSVRQGWTLKNYNINDLQAGDIIFYKTEGDSHYLQIANENSALICVGPNSNGVVIGLGVENGTAKYFTINTSTTSYSSNNIILVARPRKD